MSASGSWITFSVFAIDGALRLLLGAAVMMRRRPVPVTLAWLLLLAFLPILSTIVYLLVGENKLGRKRLAQHSKIDRAMSARVDELWRQTEVRHFTERDVFEHVARFGTNVSGMPALRGNIVTLVPDNDTMLEALIRDIDAAKHHAHLMYYIWSLDAGSERVSEALIRAAQRGVETRVLVDGVGAWSFIRSPLWLRMTEAGVRLVEALPVNWWRRPLSRLDLRNHRKVAVMDGRIAYCGSQNIHDTTFRAKKYRKTGQWIDASVRVEGPVAQALAVTFIIDWTLDSEEDLTGSLAKYLPELALPEDGESIAQVIPSGPGETPTAIHQAFLTLIYAAREELVMATPYFVPDEATLAALMAAAQRGVQVTLIMPQVSDSILVAAASRAYYPEMLDAGVKIFHFHKGLLHAKTLTIDRQVGLIGSANFDARSFFLNFEITLLAYDRDFASKLWHMQTGYLRDSHEITKEVWRLRPWWKPIRDNVARLFGPLL